MHPKDGRSLSFDWHISPYQATEWQKMAFCKYLTIKNYSAHIKIEDGWQEKKGRFNKYSKQAASQKLPSASYQKFQLSIIRPKESSIGLCTLDQKRCVVQVLYCTWRMQCSITEWLRRQRRQMSRELVDCYTKKIGVTAAKTNTSSIVVVVGGNT